MLLESLISLSLSSPSFTRDILPIMKERCAQCHNETWPEKNWLNYSKVVANKAVIKFRVNNFTMPPSNFTKMTKSERELLSKWIDNGTPK